MGPRDGIEARLRHAFGLPLGDIEEAIAAACRDDVFDRATVEAIAAANRAWGTATGLNTCDVIAAWLAGDGAARAARLADLSGIVLKKDGESRRSEEHTSELQSLMRISYAVFCWKKKTT